MPVPTLDEAKVPVPTNVTASPETTPERVPVMVALVVPSYTLELTAGLVIVNSLAEISAVNPVGCVIE
jgi:hypothetical protein